MQQKISEICTLIQGKNIDKKKLSDKGIPYITGASCIQKGVVVCDRFVDAGTCGNMAVATKGDLIVSCVGTLGKIGMLQYDQAVVSKHVFALHPFKEMDVLYLLAMVTYTLADIVPEDQSDGVGFSNKFDPEMLMDASIAIPEKDEQRWLVSMLVRYAILQVATNLDHIKPLEIREAIDMLNELSSDTRKRIRNQLKKLDELEKLLEECPAVMEDTSCDNPFVLLFEERKRMNKLLKIL